VLHGSADDALLDTYQEERAPHVRQIVEAAVNFGRLICTTDPDLAAHRDADMLAARAAGGGTTGTAAMPPLRPGHLVHDGGGAQLPQVVVDGQPLDDLIGDRFAVLVRGPELLDQAADDWRRIGAVVMVAQGAPALVDVLDRINADTAIARPDRYLYSSGRRLVAPLPSAWWTDLD
jgi:3-(3-hydroxy-phenyl)propionate hydroxylase